MKWQTIIVNHYCDTTATIQSKVEVNRILFGMQQTQVETLNTRLFFVKILSRSRGATFLQHFMHVNVQNYINNKTISVC